MKKLMKKSISQISNCKIQPNFRKDLPIKQCYLYLTFGLIRSKGQWLLGVNTSHCKWVCLISLKQVAVSLWFFYIFVNGNDIHNSLTKFTKKKIFSVLIFNFFVWCRNLYMESTLAWNSLLKSSNWLQAI